METNRPSAPSTPPLELPANLEIEYVESGTNRSFTIRADIRLCPNAASQWPRTHYLPDCDVAIGRQTVPARACR